MRPSSAPGSPRPASEIVKGFQALATTALSDWEKKHRAGVDAALKAGGFRG